VKTKANEMHAVETKRNRNVMGEVNVCSRGIQDGLFFSNAASTN
jgi:hypothetical protein